MLGLGLQISNPRKSLGFQISSLFKNNEVGVWFDPSDLSTLFQDGAGVTPVTAAGQTVGFIGDKRNGSLYGPEKVTNGSFTNGTTGWATSATFAASAAVVSNELQVTNVASYGRYVSEISGLVVGQTYSFTATARAITGSNATIGLTTDSGGGALGTLNLRVIATTATPVTATLTFNATATTLYIGAGDNSNQAVGTVNGFSNVSVKMWKGNHAKQTTTAAMPIYQSAPARTVFDGVDDALNITFAAIPGSACTVACAIPGTGAQILTGQTIGTNYAVNTNNCGLIIINRALTTAETTGVTAYLNAKAGV